MSHDLQPKVCIHSCQKHITPHHLEEITHLFPPLLPLHLRLLPLLYKILYFIDDERSRRSSRFREVFQHDCNHNTPLSTPRNQRPDLRSSSQPSCHSCPSPRGAISPMALFMHVPHKRRGCSRTLRSTITVDQRGKQRPNLICSAILASSAFKLNVGLIRTCRLIYHDAKLVPFRHNTFFFTTCEALTLFLERTPAAVEILIESREHLDLWDICLAKVATTMSSLRDVHINIEQILGEIWYTRHVRSRPRFDVMDEINNGQFKATLLRLAALELRDAKVAFKLSCQSYWPPDHLDIDEEDHTSSRMLWVEAWAKEVEKGLLVRKMDEKLNESSRKERVTEV